MRRSVLGTVLLLALAGCATTPSVANPAPAPSASPSPSVSPSPSASPSAEPSLPPTAAQYQCGTGENHAAVAQALSKLGYAADCAGITKFQERFDIRPADGIAGPVTNGVAQRLAATDTASCDAGWGTVACIDLTNQTTWVMRDGKVILGPTVTRTGMKDFATPTGSYTVDWKSLKDWSRPYKVWLPYWMSFNNDIGFHETTSYLHNAAIGSHGCVNLLHQDAVAFYEALDEGSTVKVFGHRPGS